MYAIRSYYVFENLSEKLERSFKLLKGDGKITELNVAETIKDIRRALLDADVNYKTAKDFTVITSYSIHYTKLYDATMCHMPQSLNVWLTSIAPQPRPNHLNGPPRFRFDHAMYFLMLWVAQKSLWP